TRGPVVWPERPAGTWRPNRLRGPGAGDSQRRKSSLWIVRRPDGRDGAKRERDHRCHFPPGRTQRARTPGNPAGGARRCRPVDAGGGAVVDATLKIDGVGAKMSGAPFDLGPITTTPPQGTAWAPGFADQPISWPPVVQSTLSLEASPAPLRPEAPLALTILATDAATGQP